MLQKHSKDIIFIVIILLLIGIIWGVPKEFWVLIMINVVVVMVGILYVKLNAVIETKDKEAAENLNDFNAEDSYKELKKVAIQEMEEFLEEADYEKFEDIIESKEAIKGFIDGNISLEQVLHQIKTICKFKLQIYYLGLSMISIADADMLFDTDYAYVTLGIKLIKEADLESNTKTLKFLKNTCLKINI